MKRKLAMLLAIAVLCTALASCTKSSGDLYTSLRNGMSGMKGDLTASYYVTEGETVVTDIHASALIGDKQTKMKLYHGDNPTDSYYILSQLGNMYIKAEPFIQYFINHWMSYSPDSYRDGMFSMPFVRDEAATATRRNLVTTVLKRFREEFPLADAKDKSTLTIEGDDAPRFLETLGNLLQSEEFTNALNEYKSAAETEMLVNALLNIAGANQDMPAYSFHVMGEELVEMAQQVREGSRAFSLNTFVKPNGKSGFKWELSWTNGAADATPRTHRLRLAYTATEFEEKKANIKETTPINSLFTQIAAELEAQHIRYEDDFRPDENQPTYEVTYHKEENKIVCVRENPLFREEVVYSLLGEKVADITMTCVSKSAVIHDSMKGVYLKQGFAVTYNSEELDPESSLIPIPTSIPTPTPDVSTVTDSPITEPTPTQGIVFITPHIPIPTPTPRVTGTPVTPRPTPPPTPRVTPTPTVKPTGAAQTPKPTNTPKPTGTPKPTNPPKPTNTPKPTVQPTVKPTNTPRPTPPPTSKPTATPRPTQIPPRPTATPKPRPKGDVDNDGQVTMQDAMLLQRYLAYINTGEGVPVYLSNEDLHYADVNGDGMVDNADVRLIMQIAMNSSTNLSSKFSTMRVIHMVGQNAEVMTEPPESAEPFEGANEGVSEEVTTPPERQIGDINNDGAITVDDMELLTLHLTAVSELSDEDKPYADINQDGAITNEDVFAIMELIQQAVDDQLNGETPEPIIVVEEPTEYTLVMQATPDTVWQWSEAFDSIELLLAVLKGK